MEAEEKQAHKRGIKKERKKGRRKHRDHVSAWSEALPWMTKNLLLHG